MSHRKQKIQHIFICALPRRLVRVRQLAHKLVDAPRKLAPLAEREALALRRAAHARVRADRGALCALAVPPALCARGELRVARDGGRAELEEARARERAGEEARERGELGDRTRGRGRRDAPEKDVHEQREKQEEAVPSVPAEVVPLQRV
jgi:hypothetical protein